jgi:hypothetical protein
MRTPASNPFTLTIQTLQGVEGTIADIRGNMLDSLSATVKQFNGLWHNNASVAFEVGDRPGLAAGLLLAAGVHAAETQLCQHTLAKNTSHHSLLTCPCRYLCACLLSSTITSRCCTGPRT